MMRTDTGYWIVYIIYTQLLTISIGYHERHQIKPWRNTEEERLLIADTSCKGITFGEIFFGVPVKTKELGKNTCRGVTWNSLDIIECHLGTLKEEKVLTNENSHKRNNLKPQKL